MVQFIPGPNVPGYIRRSKNIAHRQNRFYAFTAYGVTHMHPSKPWRCAQSTGSLIAYPRLLQR